MNESRIKAILESTSRTMAKGPAVPAEEAEAAIVQLEAVLPDLRELRSELRPPPKETVLLPGVDPDPTLRAGRLYQQALYRGAPEDVQAVRDRFDRVTAQLEAVEGRIRELRRRVEHSREREAREAAPGRARALLEELPAVLDDLDRGLEAVADALERRAELLRELHDARQLCPAGARPWWTPQLLRRKWASDIQDVSLNPRALRGMLSTREEAIDVLAKDSFSRARFIDPARVRELEDKLPPVEKGLIEELRAFFAGRGGDPATERAIQEARIKLIAAGRFEDADDARVLEEEARGDRQPGTPLTSIGRVLHG